MTADPAFEVYGIPIPADEARSVNDGITVFQADGEPITRWRTAAAVPTNRCLCSHGRSAHSTDRRGRLVCFGSSVCGCISYRPKDKK